MSFFHKSGSLAFGSVTLTNATPSAVIYTPAASTWTDVYSVTITSDETASRAITVSDGTTSQLYELAAGAGPIPPLVDASDVPIRFRRGVAIIVSASAVTAGRHIAVNFRGLATVT